MGGLIKSKRVGDEEEVREPYFILIDRKNRKVWHEQFRSWAEAKGKIDYEKQTNGIVGNWEIEQV